MKRWLVKCSGAHLKGQSRTHKHQGGCGEAEALAKACHELGFGLVFNRTIRPTQVSKQYDPQPHALLFQNESFKKWCLYRVS